TELRQFAQLASHDLKTPLATVANLCDEALDEFGEEMSAEAVNLIAKARERTFRMSATIDELLASTMITDIEGVIQPTASQQVIADAVEAVHPVLEKRGINLRVAEDMPTVQAEKARLREVFSNLL